MFSLKNSILVFVCLCCCCILSGQAVSRRTPVVEVVERMGPAIVNISTERLVETNFPSEADFFQEFFGYNPRVSKTYSLGSGVIITSDGFIVTCEHVIRRASKINVILSNKRTLVATLLASDLENDLALLKIQSLDPLPFIKLGNSSDVLIGETVIALGNPFGLQNSVTTGVISATNRSIPIAGKVSFNDFLQTDAAINPGNSGGALLNILGQFIGVNCAISAKGQGLGFAIPIDRVRHVMGKLLDYRKLKQYWLGLELEEVEQGETCAVYVKNVEQLSPASKSGIEKGNLIKKVGDVPIQSIFDFHKEIYSKNIDDTVLLTIESSGTSKTVTLKIAQSSGTLLIWKRLGVLPVQTDLGVMVKSIRVGSSAERIGMKMGDIIISLGEEPISTVEELRFLIQSAEEKQVVPVVLLRNVRRLTGKIVIE